MSPSKAVELEINKTETSKEGKNFVVIKGSIYISCIIIINAGEGFARDYQHIIYFNDDSTAPTELICRTNTEFEFSFSSAAPILSLNFPL